MMLHLLDVHADFPVRDRTQRNGSGVREIEMQSLTVAATVQNRFPSRANDDRQCIRRACDEKYDEVFPAVSELFQGADMPASDA